MTLFTRSPSGAFLPFLFFGEGSPTKIDDRRKWVITLILTSLLDPVQKCSLRATSLHFTRDYASSKPAARIREALGVEGYLHRTPANQRCC